MPKTPFESLLADQEMMEELQDLGHSKGGLARAKEAPGGKKSVTKALESFAETPRPQLQPDTFFAEAIVLANGRPSLLVRDGQFEKPGTTVWRKRLTPHKATSEGRIPSVGRVELLSHPDFEWVGTAWMVADDVLVTNRHVAQLFAERQGGQFQFGRNFMGQTIGARVDFREEYERPHSFELSIEEILYIAEPGSFHPDMAFLRVQKHAKLPAPIPLAAANAKEGDLICVVGYPARDSRNAGSVMSRIFQDIFDVKRFAPGYVLSQEGSVTFTHDCTTLGGNSGSAVIDLASGEAVGLHFAGRFGIANYAVNVSTVKQILHRMDNFSIAVNGSEVEKRRRAEDYADRKGYQEDFLGQDPALHIPLPVLCAEARGDAVPVNRNLRGMSRFALDYTHFSVIMSHARRLAYYTAVNIDGSQEVVVRRRSTTWRTDPRIDADLQADNRFYRHNNLDRGHLVRRLDPVWGSDDVAKLADEDTFHYTNAAPQHAKLNQRNWLDLEDYLLGNINNSDLKLTVFTGPIFGAGDPEYRGIQLPQSFWKVAAMAVDGQLVATAYQLGQTQFLDDLEFAIGEFRTYQVPITTIEETTGLSFGCLSDFDPLSRIEGMAYQPIRGPEDLIL